jgi:hypothetical protein
MIPALMMMKLMKPIAEMAMTEDSFNNVFLISMTKVQRLDLSSIQ